MTADHALEAPDNLEDHIQCLVAFSQVNPSFESLICASLQTARKTAETTLDRALFNALPWPETFAEYITFLGDFARWCPQQDTNPAWARDDGDGQQEVYDRGCHFFWLIDQPAGPGGSTIVQNQSWFSHWMIGYASLYGDFLDTPASFGPDILNSFIRLSPQYAIGDSMVDGKPNCPSGWQTFNQFFARKLNSGLRPIAHPEDNRVLVAPADCTFKQKYEIDAKSCIPEITIKRTHKFASVGQLLDGSPFSDSFRNGIMLHFFLGPYSYHRYHAPVSGTVQECRKVHGLTYMGVRLNGNQFLALDDAENGYQFAQSRGVLVLDTAGCDLGDIGLVAVVPVGMCHISSVNFTTKTGATLTKGEEFGYFAFGGSDIIILLQERAGLKLTLPQDYIKYGTMIAAGQTPEP